MTDVDRRGQSDRDVSTVLAALNDAEKKALDRLNELAEMTEEIESENNFEVDLQACRNFMGYLEIPIHTGKLRDAVESSIELTENELKDYGNKNARLKKFSSEFRRTRDLLAQGLLRIADEVEKKAASLFSKLNANEKESLEKLRELTAAAEAIEEKSKYRIQLQACRDFVGCLKMTLLDGSPRDRMEELVTFTELDLKKANTKNNAFLKFATEFRKARDTVVSGLLRLTSR